MKRRLVIAALVAGAYMAGIAWGPAPVIAGGTVQVKVPMCQEDEPWLKGKGDFSGGHWSRYVCVHQDNVRKV